MPDTRLAVAVVDGRRLVREGVCALLSDQADFTVTAAETCGELDLTVTQVMVLGESSDTLPPSAGAVVRLADITDPGRLAELVQDASRNVRRWRTPTASPRRMPAQLTAREHQVLYEIGRGLSAAEIGAALGISARTVERHRQSLMTKLRSGSPAGAIARSSVPGALRDAG